MKKQANIVRLFILSIILTAACAAAAGQKNPNSPLHEIPFEYELDKIILPVSVNGNKTVRLILDTGMPEGIFIMKPKSAEGMGLNYAATNVMLRGAGSGAASAKMAMDGELRLAEIEFSKQRVIVLNNESPLSHTDWDGAIGASIFNRFVVEIDVEKEMLRLYAPDKFDVKEAGEALELTITRTKPYIKAFVNIEGKKEVPITAVVDTGANSGLVISTAKGWVAPANSIDGVVGRGVGGDVEAAVARASSLSLGKHKVRNIITMFNRGEMPMNAEALIGMGILSRFFVTFDYTAKKMYLRPNGRFKDAFEFNMIGLSIRSENENSLIVAGVIKGSPAADAGIKTGDTLISIEGNKVSYSAYAKIMEKMREPGKKIEVEFERDGKKFTKTLVSRRLI